MLGPARFGGRLTKPAIYVRCDLMTAGLPPASSPERSEACDYANVFSQGINFG
jgi:hypothetical protein